MLTLSNGKNKSIHRRNRSKVFIFLIPNFHKILKTYITRYVRVTQPDVLHIALFRRRVDLPFCRHLKGMSTRSLRTMRTPHRAFIHNIMSLHGVPLPIENPNQTSLTELFQLDSRYYVTRRDYAPVRWWCAPWEACLCWVIFLYTGLLLNLCESLE